MRSPTRSVPLAGSLFALALLAWTRPPARAAATSAETVGLSDANIAAIVLAANTVDIDNAELALKTSTNESVKSFAQQMVTDHTSVNAKAEALAGKLTLTPKPNGTSKSLLSKGTANRRRMAKRKGAAFDRAYLDNEISYHRAVIDLLTSQLVPGAKNGELRDLLTSVQASLAEHLQHAKDMRAALKE